MKKQTNTPIAKKVFTLFLAAFLLCGMAQKSYALPDKATAKGTEITYKGLKDNKLVFSVNYKNELSEVFELVIKNDQNEVIYQKQYGANPLNATLLFSEVPENCKLTFFIKTAKKEVTQAFEINSQVKTVEEYIVKGI